MKRFFESGYNYIQDVVLKPGTYVFWAYIKSEFGDTFTFALANEANEWEVFDVDVEMGQWSKVYEVITITEKKVKLDLIHRYYDSEQPVFVFKPQLIKGNIPTDAGASPFDIDSIVDDLHDNIQGIADFTNEEFADRVLSASERISLKRDMEAVETIFQSLKGSYEKLIINPFVPEAVITDLTAKYNAVMSAKTNLFNVLNLIIAGDNIVTPEEITAKDDALLALNAALYNYNLAEKEIQNALGADYTQKISAIRDFTDNEFADRYLSETEKISLSHDLDSVQTLVDSVTSRFNEMLLNPFLTGADRDLLIEKYNALLDAWDWDEDLDPFKPNGLKTIILNIINGDDIIDPVEMLEKDAALSAFNIALGEFSETEVYVSKITIDYAIEQATFWSINATSPVIYKDAKDAVTDGHHMPVTVKGQLHRGTQLQDGGYLTVTADADVEAVEASPSPVVIEPLDYDDKSLYTIRLYDSAAKTILLDTMTIPVVFRGANGKDAINITLSNEIDSVPASNEGVVSSYDNTGTDIRVFEGVTELTYDGVGTSPGTFKVTSLGIDLTVGQISSPTVGILKCVVGNISNLLADKGITQFTITGKTLGGESFSEVKEQRVTKGKMGAPGDPGDPGEPGQPGEDGDGITSTTIHYAKSSSGTTPPSSGWSTSLPSPTQGWYLWTRTTTTYKVAATTVSYSVSHWAEDGDGIVSTTIEYAKSSSGTTPPSSGWSTNLPSPTLGWYLWTRTTTTYKKSETTVAYSVSRYAEDGDPGDSVVHIYKQYPTKPSTPSSGVANPTGWSRNPDYILSIDGQTNWAVNGKWHQSEELTATGNSTTSRISFTTHKDAQTITLELWADGHATYDYVYAGNLDTAASTSNYYDRVRAGRIIITYDVPAAGSHYIDIFWRKGISTIAGSNRGYYAIITNVKVWRSATNVIGGVYQTWSEPQQFLIDTSAEERIYCLSKTTTAPAISDSDAYINDYIPLPCSLSSYRGDFTTYRAYSIGQVVIYQFEYYKVVKTITSASTRYPTDEEYFEKIPGWTDNPVGANKDYPFEFVAIRKKQSDGLWGTFVPSVWTKWAEDGDPGEPGKGVSSVVIWYYKSSSATQLQGGSWSTTKPDYSASFFLWTKVITTYTDNSTTETTPILDPDWHKVMAITDKFGVTIDGALIQAVMMLLREANSLDVTAGISGVRGTLKNNPSYWSGGTYAQAFALIEFLSKMSAGTTPSAGEYSNLAKIIMLHNGAGKYGDLIVEPSGRVVMVDPATGKSRLVFGVENIPTIATLLAGTIYSGSTAVGGGSTASVLTLSGSTNVTKYGATATFNGTTISISASGKAQANGFSSFAVAELYAYCNGVKTLALATAMIYFTNDVNYQNDFDTVVVPTTSSYLTDAGTYTFKLEVITEGDISFATAECTSSSFAWSYTLQGVKRQQYGLDGMMFFYSDRHFHYTEGAGLDLRGPTDMPGKLLSGSVGLNGGFNVIWGAKKHASLNAVRNALGQYTVYHSIGHSDYSVQITPETSGRAFYVPSANKGNSNFVVYFTNLSGAAADSNFSFEISGRNY